MAREVKNETEIFDYVELDKITQINGNLHELQIHFNELQKGFGEFKLYQFQQIYVKHLNLCLLKLSLKDNIKLDEQSMLSIVAHVLNSGDYVNDIYRKHGIKLLLTKCINSFLGFDRFQKEKKLEKSELNKFLKQTYLATQSPPFHSKFEYNINTVDNKMKIQTMKKTIKQLPKNKKYLVHLNKLNSGKI